MIGRRSFLHALAGVPLVACIGETDDMGEKLAPWHLWGVSAPFNITLATPNITVATSQLVRVNYRRPTAWRFLVWANWAKVTTVGASDSCIVNFDLLVGNGRAQVTISQWIQLTQTIGNNGSAFLWSNMAPVFGLNNTGLAANTWPTSDSIIGQDIQCSARVILNGNVGDTAAGEVGAMFAPEVHDRPDWLGWTRH